MDRFKKVISVIIPFYNRVDFLIETLESIRSQSFQDFEVFIIDDNSKSENFIEAEKYLARIDDHRFKLFKKPNYVSKGANGSRNYGFNISKGKYIKWFDSDDIMLPEFLQIQMDTMEQADLDGVLGNCGVYNEDFSEKLRSSWKPKIYSNNILRDYLRTQLAWQTGSGLWKRDSIQKKIKPFEQEITNAQEWIFHLFILTSDLNIGIIEDELYKVRSHSNSISLNYKKENLKKYFLNRFKARTIGLSRLIETGNRPKRTILKSLFGMMTKFPIRYWPEFMDLFFKNFKYRSRSTPISRLIKIKKK